MTRTPDGTARRVRPLSAFRDRVRSWPGGRMLWRVGVTLVGVAVIVIGIVLLPLPGPGWLIIFAGLGILATEYVWAKRLLAFAKEKFKSWTLWLGLRPLWVRALFGLAITALIAAVAYVAWRFYR